MRNTTSLLPVLLVFIFSFQNCTHQKAPIPTDSAQPKDTIQPTTDQVTPFQLKDIRLGDGVPLTLQLSLRWMSEDAKSFFAQFNTKNEFSTLILQPRAYEIISSVSNLYPSVDSVFYNHRQPFITEIKETLIDRLGGEEVIVKEVIVSDILFPNTYTDAMEQAGLQQQALEKIAQQNIVDLAKAEANKKKAEAEAKVLIAQAEADARVQKIKAQTEKDRRQNQMAKAETEAQISKKQAEAEATRQKLLAKAELEKKTDLKNLDIQRQIDLLNLDIEKERKLAEVDREGQLELAKMFQENPTYASFIVNKELAGKVEIAVLPSGADGNVFGNFLKQTIPTKGN